MQSRYYDPETGRFLNADGLVSTGQGVLDKNMFAYCLNNPVMYKDSTGMAAEVLAILAIAAILPGLKAQYGAAKPYVEMKGSSNSNSPNCYAYAVGSSTNKQPGGSSGKSPTKNNSVTSVGKSVVADLKADGFTVREISGPYAKVYENEFRIALAVGTKPYAKDKMGNLYYDYHFMVQTNTGQWAEKHGYGGDSILWDSGMTPDTIPWTLGGVPYYDDGPLYYAIGE